MFATLSRSWELFKESWAVLRSDPSLATFPTIAAIVTLIVSILFWGIIGLVIATNPALAAALNDSDGARANDEGNPILLIVGLIVLFFYYLIINIVTNYLTTALVGVVLKRFRRESTSSADGWAIAQSRLPAIVQFSAISATVGVVLNMLRGNDNRFGIGDIIASLGGAAYSLATFLVIPIIATKPIGAIPALKESVNLIQRTWGESVIGSTGIGLVVSIPMTLLAILGVFLAITAFAADQIVLGVIVIVVTVLVIAVLGVISSALDSIYKAAVYHYAEAGAGNNAQELRELPFRPDLIEGAFKPKQA